MKTLIAALALALAAPAAADSAWRPVDAETGQIRDVEGLEQLAKDFPDSGSVRLRLLQPLLQAGETDKLLKTLSWLQERGYVFGETSQAQIPKLLGEPYIQAARALLIAKADVIESSEVFATVPADARLVESVLPDLESGQILATSVIGRELWGMAKDGSWMPFAVPHADNLSGIAFDVRERRIWIASGSIDGSERDPRLRAGLVSPSMGRGEDAWVMAPEGVALSDVHAAANGTIFASDPIGGGVYRKQPASRTLETLVAPGTLRSPQGLATSQDGKTLYVSDYRYGVAIVDLKTAAISRLTTELPIILDGVDGMWRYKDELIVVQNGTSPMRIAALALSEDGRSVVGHRILEQANPGWTEPLGGALGKGDLFYVANGQWDRFVAGQPAQDKPPISTQIRRLRLGERDIP